MHRHVKGSFFAEYVRMIRRRKDLAWGQDLTEDDLAYVRSHIDPEAWYPMQTFERLGVAILRHLEGASMESVRLWGRFSADAFVAEHPGLLARCDPVETLMRLKVQRETLFDFPAFDIPVLVERYAEVTVRYLMGPIAEEAASVQTMGFCEGMLSLAGAEEVRGRFQSRSWTGDSQTRFILEWT